MFYGVNSMPDKKTGGQPKPPQLHIIQGTFREDRHGSRDAVMSEEVLKRVPTAPAMSSDVFKRWWKSYCDDLIQVGVLTQRDLKAVQMLCDAHEQMEKASDIRDEAERNGMLYYLNDSGNYVKHPALAEINALRTVIQKYQKELGMTPTARLRITPKIPDQSKKKNGGVQSMSRTGG